MSKIAEDNRCPVGVENAQQIRSLEKNSDTLFSKIESIQRWLFGIAGGQEACLRIAPYEIEEDAGNLGEGAAVDQKRLLLKIGLDLPPGPAKQSAPDVRNRIAEGGVLTAQLAV